MKTTLVKKGSEKNIEMFKMSNEELAVVNGGGCGEVVFTVGPDGKTIIIIRGESATIRSFAR